MGKRDKDVVDERSKIIEHELNLVFNTFDIGQYDRTRDELRELRLLADDLEDVEVLVAQRILDGTDIKEDEEDFQKIVEFCVYGYYLALHFTKMYLDTEDFKGLTGKDFPTVWREIDNQDKATVIEMTILVEDAMAIVHGMYLLLTQVERKGGMKQ